MAPLKFFFRFYSSLIWFTLYFCSAQQLRRYSFWIPRRAGQAELACVWLMNRRRRFVWNGGKSVQWSDDLSAKWRVGTVCLSAEPLPRRHRPHRSCHIANVHNVTMSVMSAVYIISVCHFTISAKSTCCRQMMTIGQLCRMTDTRPPLEWDKTKTHSIRDT